MSEFAVTEVLSCGHGLRQFDRALHQDVHAVGAEYERQCQSCLNNSCKVLKIICSFYKVPLPTDPSTNPPFLKAWGIARIPVPTIPFRKRIIV